MKIFKTLLAWSLLAAVVSAEPVAFINARVIDGKGQVATENTVVVEDGKIVSVGPGERLTPPANAKIYDLRGKTLLPGLISDHSHVGQTSGTSSGPEFFTPANIARQLGVYQRYGVTTVNSLGLNGPAFLEMRERAHAGEIDGADLFGADRGIGAPNGAPPVQVGPDQLYRPVNAEQARQAVREMAQRKTDLVKIWVDDFHHTLEHKMQPEVYQAVIDEAHRHNVRVAAHVYYYEDAVRLVESGVDILAHGIRDREVEQPLVEAMKANGTWYIATLTLDETFYIYAEAPAWTRSEFFRQALQPELAAQFDDPVWRQKTLKDSAKVARDKESLRINMENLSRLYRGGVKVGFGTDSGANPLRVPGFEEHRELELMVQAGLTPLQAVTAATGQAAALMGLTDRGEIAAGKRADFIVVEGDPSSDILALRSISSVWREGRQVSGPLP